MATNAAPVYGKQYIRFAETFEAAADTQAGAIGTVEIGEYRVVAAAPWAGPGACAPPNAFTTPPTEIVGVNQALIPTALSQPYTARQASVANSGLLLIEQDPAAPFTTADIGAPLEINGKGQATKTGTLVTMNGTAPRLRAVSVTGGRSFATFSFT